MDSDSLDIRKDQLTGALIGLARATEGNEHLISESSTALIVEGLYAAGPDSGCGDARLESLLGQVDTQKRKMVPNCFECASPCGRTDAFDLRKLREEDGEVRILKEELLRWLRDIASDLFHEMVAEPERDKAEKMLYQGLIVLGVEGYKPMDLRRILEEMKHE